MTAGLTMGPSAFGPRCDHDRTIPLYGGILQRCRECGVVATARIPQFAYTETYFTSASEGGYDFHAALAVAIDRERFTQELDRLQRQGLSGSILDIGCATGSFLAMAASRGWRVAGVELAAYARARAAAAIGAPVAASLADLPPGARYDVVTLHHVLEHVDAPLAFLRDQVAPRVGRRLLVEVPNFQSLASRVHQGRWRDLRVEQHVYHYEPATLGALVTAAGLRVTAVYTLWEPLWTLRTALELVGLLGRALTGATRRAGHGNVTEHALGLEHAGRYRQPRGLKWCATELSRLVCLPVVRVLERARLGPRLVVEAESGPSGC